MDELFRYDVTEMLKRLREIEPEMREAHYYRSDPEKIEEYSSFANNSLREIFTYMKRYYCEEENTILRALKELYLIATTGEVSKYQNEDEICFEHEIYRRISGIGGVNAIRYAAEWLKYYHLVYESENETDELQNAFQNMGYKFFKLLKLYEYRYKVPKIRDSQKLPENEFMSELKKHMDKLVVGQEALKKKLISILYQWIYKNERTNLLMIGPSGTGKNYTIDAVRSFWGLGRVVISYDCSNLTPAGFQGDAVSTIFKKLTDKCKAMGINTEGSIVYLDEVDKIINFNHDSNGESVNAMVQQQLLSSLAGTDIIMGVDTRKILFILGGAFPRIDDLERDRSRHKVGFSLASETIMDCKTTLRDQLCAIGGEKEFVGRIEEIVQLEKLTRDHLRAILMDENIGVFTQKKNMFIRSGIDLEIEEELIEDILDMVEREDAGARGVKNVVNMLVDSQYFYDMKMAECNKMIIHKGMLYGELPIFTKEEEKNGGLYK